MRGILLLVIVLLTVGACSKHNPPLKSPCVGAKGSPCDRRPANTWLS